MTGRSERRSGRRAGVVIACLLLAACTSAPAGSGEPPQDAESTLLVEAPQTLIVTGDDGVALTDGERLEPVEELSGDAYFGWAGATAAALPEGGAALVGAERVAIVLADGTAAVADCAGCAGVAVSGEHIVTTRRNYSPGEGFDIVLLSRDLSEDRVVPTERVPERASADFPAENTESPVTLAADPDRITVGYLSRNGGVRGGPSLIAQYDYDGNLLQHVEVDGLIGGAVPSPDGRYLAVGVGGSGGACITVSEPVAIELASLEVYPVEPDVPSGATVDPSSLSGAWFLLIDLVWRDSTLIATGQVHSPPADETCDEEPEVWQRTFDPASGDLQDKPGTNMAVRWVGPDCEDTVEVRMTPTGAELISRVGGHERMLGKYGQISLGQAPPAEC